MGPRDYALAAAAVMLVISTIAPESVIWNTKAVYLFAVVIGLQALVQWKYSGAHCEHPLAASARLFYAFMLVALAMAFVTGVLFLGFGAEILSAAEATLLMASSSYFEPPPHRGERTKKNYGPISAGEAA